MDPKLLHSRIMSVNSKLSALLDLLKGPSSDEKKWADLEVLLGITSRAEFAIALSQLETMEALVSQTTISAKALYENAKLMRASGAASA